MTPKFWNASLSPLLDAVAPHRALETYGRLIEGVHLSGYTFERACQHLEWLLVGDRWQACGDFKDINVFLDSLRLDQFRPVAETRKRVAERIRELQPEVSNRQIARTLGVAEGTIRNDTAQNYAPRAQNPKQSASPEGRPAQNYAPASLTGDDTARAEHSPPPTLTGAEAARAAERAALHQVRGTFGTGDTEWFTPPQYIDAAREVMGGIDVDPATHPVAQQTVGAVNHYTADDDGLSHQWHGRVWVNPPYAQPLIAQFITKLVGEVGAGRVEQAILLTHNYTDTAWFHEAEAAADLLCFTRGRIKFVDADGNDCAPTQGQAFFYYGPAGARFREIFRRFGFVVATLAETG